jgi:hypothetical protein
MNLVLKAGRKKVNKEIQKLGKKRQGAHPNGTERYYSNPNVEDTIGVAGEAAFARRYNLQIDKRILPEGDNHIDFIVDINGNKVSIDVKTAQKAYNLLIKKWEIEKCADILVLAEIKNDNINFLGWETKDVMKLMPTKVFSSLNIENYYRNREALRPMAQLDKLLTNNNNDLKKIALEREHVHKDHASSRPLSKGYEYVGMVGEAQFAKEFNFKLDKELRPEGDGGKDFSCSLGTIDVKTARKAFNLIVEEGHVRADIHVLAQYNENKETATLLGWAHKEEVLDAPKKDFGYGVINHYIPKNKLRPIESLKQELGIKVDDFGF